VAGDLRTNRNELLLLFTRVWAELPGLIGITKGVPSTGWPYVLTMTDADTVPLNPAKLPWARVTIQHTRAVTRGVGRVFRQEHSGIFTVQNFVFRDRDSADNQVQLMAGALAKEFGKHGGNVTLTDIGPRERPIDTGYARCDVVSGFSWDERVRRD
jgi:hypothetical protein